MLFRVLSILLVVGLLTSCSSTKDNKAGTGDGLGSEGYTDSSINSGNLNILPGSQADLTENVGDRVFFEFNSAVLDANSQKTLSRQSDWLKTYGNVHVTIEGHCDERGTREYNLALGERRAVAAKNYLVSLGIGADRLSTISYGKERPEYLGSNEAAWSKNRRGVLVIN